MGFIYFLFIHRTCQVRNSFVLSVDRVQLNYHDLFIYITLFLCLFQEPARFVTALVLLSLFRVVCMHRIVEWDMGTCIVLLVGYGYMHRIV